MCVHPQGQREKILKSVVNRAHVKSVFAALVLLLCAAVTFSQQAEPEKKPAEKDAKTQTTKPGVKPYTLTVKTRPILNISLKADKANMADVAQDLSKRLKTPVFLGTERQKEPLSIEFANLHLNQRFSYSPQPSTSIMRSTAAGKTRRARWASSYTMSIKVSPPCQPWSTARRSPC